MVDIVEELKNKVTTIKTLHPHQFTLPHARTRTHVGTFEPSNYANHAQSHGWRTFSRVDSFAMCIVQPFTSSVESLISDFRSSDTSC